MELTPSVRREVAKDLRAYIDLLTKSEPTFIEAPSITPGAGDASTRIDEVCHLPLIVRWMPPDNDRSNVIEPEPD